MSWETQGRQYHGYFGSGRAGTTAKKQPYRPTAQVIDVMDRRSSGSDHQPPHSAAATTDLHDHNVEDLARVIASEARGRPLAEQTAVGQILMNRIHRAPPDWTVEQVWSGFAHKTPPDDAERILARNIIDGESAGYIEGRHPFLFAADHA